MVMAIVIDGGIGGDDSDVGSGGWLWLCGANSGD